MRRQQSAEWDGALEGEGEGREERESNIKGTLETKKRDKGSIGRAEAVSVLH